MDTYRVRITEPTVIAPVGQDREHVAVGTVVEVPADDAFNLVSSGKGVIVNGELPNSPKPAAKSKGGE